MPNSDPSPEHLARLAPDVAALAVRLLNAARLVGVPLAITSSLRTTEAQADLVRKGLSQRLDSLHLRGRAFDVDVLGMHRDSVPTWWWESLGKYGEQLGLRWGGRWRTLLDLAHFEK